MARVISRAMSGRTILAAGAGFYAAISAVLRAVLLLALLIIAAAPGVSPAAAQSAPAPQPAAAPAPVNAAELERLVDTLQDNAQRARLIEELRALIAAQRGMEAQEEAGPTT